MNLETVCGLIHSVKKEKVLQILGKNKRHFYPLQHHFNGIPLPDKVSEDSTIIPESNATRTSMTGNAFPLHSKTDKTLT